ncbi:MAG: CBS domain-containing protein [Candidatus Acidiferrales bacterium]
MAEQYKVGDFMTSPVTSLSPRSSLLEAALMMRRTGYRHIPITEDDRLVGIITDRDVSRLAPSRLEKITAEEYNSVLDATVLESVMTAHPVTVTLATPVIEAVALLHRRKLGCLPVVDGEKLAGIITVTDMLEILYRLLGGKAVSAFELEST